MKKKITAVLLGAGARGGVYARYALDHPDEFQIVAIAEPDTAKREAMKKAHKIPEDSVYETWEPLLEQPRFADAALICTMDQMHTGPAVKALELGYHVLLEKPMAVREEDCRRIGAAAEKNKRLLSICHVLRYTPFYSEIKRIIDSLRFLPLLRSPLLSGASKGSFRRFRVNGDNGTGKGKTDGSPAPWTLRPLCLSLR